MLSARNDDDSSDGDVLTMTTGVREIKTSNQPQSNRSTLAKYWPAVAIGLLIRLAVIPFLYREWLDPNGAWAFGRVARSIVAGHGFGNVFAETGPTAVLAPVYAYLLAGIFRVMGIYTPASIMTALAINSLFSALTCIPVFFIAREGFGDRAAKWAVWGWALSPYGIYYGADWAWSTCLVTLQLAVLFLMAVRLEKSERTRGWVWYGLLGGIAALTEPVILAVVPLLGLWTLYRRAGHGRPWKAPMAAAALSALAVLTPWFLRNYETFHHFIPVRSGFGLELYIGNNGYSTRWVNSALHPNHNDAELREYEQTGELAYMEYKRQQAMDYIGGHPGWYAWMTARRILYMWTGYWSFDRAYLKDEPLDPPNIFVETTMSVLALMGLWRVFRRDVSMGMRFAIVLVFFPLVYYFSHPETYYFRPVDPLIVVLAAVAVAGGNRGQEPARQTLALRALGQGFTI